MTEPSSEMIAYATPVSRPTARTWAATMILIGGLSLIALGGCFLIGVMMTIQHIGFNGNVQQLPLTPVERVFAAVLSLLSAITFIGAGILLITGVRALLRIVR